MSDWHDDQEEHNLAMSVAEEVERQADYEYEMAIADYLDDLELDER